MFRRQLLSHLLLVGFLCLCKLEHSLSDSDQLLSLPGLNFDINFRQYSGYLNAGDGNHFHYWFTESQSNPSSDPFLLWLNGGPGCSSLGGLLTELGPFNIADDGETLVENKYSWNRNANILFLESPAGVGFSYVEGDDITTNDDQVADHNYNALKDFFSKFPQFKSNKFFITGESYGGIYVPTLALRVAQGLDHFPLDFQGFAIGNGLYSYKLNTNTLAQFGYAHGLIGEKLYRDVEKYCCNGCLETCDLTTSTGQCEQQANQISTIIENIGLNVYDLYRDCYHPVQSIKYYPRYWTDMETVFPQFANRFRDLKMIQQSRSDTAEDRLPTEDELLPCLNGTGVTHYLNQPSVRKALNIPEKVIRWHQCSAAISPIYGRVYKDMSQVFHSLLTFPQLRVLIYHGDTDMACNFMQGKQFIAGLGLPLLEESRQWFCGDQIAGFVTRYQNVDFLTVKGTGHMVPEWKPRQSFKMITQFLNNQEY